MFSKDLIACAVVFFSLSLQTSAQAVITPALGVSGTPVSSDAQQPSSSAECGQINIADNINSATPITAAADGTFSATIVNFETGTEGSRQVTALVDPTCTGDSFVSATVSQNGDESPTAVGSQTLTVQLPSDTTCTGGTAGNLCLVSFTTAGGFGNCVVVQQDTAASGSTGGSTGNGNSGSTGNAGSTGNGNASPKRDVNAVPNAGNPPPPTPTPTPPAPNTPAQPKPKVQRDFRAINARSNGNVNAVPNAGNPPPPTPTPTPPAPNTPAQPKPKVQRDFLAINARSNGNVNAVPNAGNPPTPTPPAPKTPAQPKPKVQRDFRAINVRSNGNVNAAPNGNNNAGNPVPPPPTPTPTPVPAPAQPKPNVQRDVRAVGSRAARALRAALDWM